MYNIDQLIKYWDVALDGFEGIVARRMLNDVEYAEILMIAASAEQLGAEHVLDRIKNMGVKF